MDSICYCFIFAGEINVEYKEMERQQFIENIKKVARQVLPKGSTLYLYGSRARGDYHEYSDWDLLLLLDKAKIEFDDFQRYSYPFVLMGLDMGEDIRPQTYTKDEWFNGQHSMFYYNVEEMIKLGWIIKF